MDTSKEDPLLKSFISADFYEKMVGGQPTRKRSGNFWSKLKKYDFILGIVLGLVGFVFGYIGFYKAFEGSLDQNVLNIIYQVVRLFLFELKAEVTSPIPWELNVGRLLCPAAASYSLILTFFSAGKKKLREFKMNFFKNHVIICGMNKWTSILAADLRKSEKRIVIITDQETHGDISKMEDLDIVVLTGSHADPYILKKARVTRAKYFIAFTESDTANMETGITVQKMVAGTSKKPDALKCFIHIRDKKLYDAFSNHEIFEVASSHFSSTLFNIYQNDARLLFLTQPFEKLLKDPEISQVHILLVGFGTLGETIFLQAARIGQYAYNQSIHITVLKDRGSDADQKFLYNFPGVNRLKEFYGATGAFDFKFIDINLDDYQQIEDILRQINQDTPISAVILCLEDETESIKLTLNLMSILDKFDFPIRFRMPFAVYFDQSEDLLKLPSEYDVEPYGLVGRSCSKEVIIQEQLDRVAKMIHRDWKMNEEKKGYTTDVNPFLVPWDQLPSSIKDSNRYQADHLLIKLRTLSVKLQPIKKKEKDVFEFTEEELLMLGQMEHNRWAAERFIAGWKYSPKKDRIKKLHSSLTHYENISEEDKTRDRGMIRHIPEMLKLLNLKLAR